VPRDDRTYITVHDGMPWHPKVEGLSDKAFRTLVQLWCWCSLNLTDGEVKAGSWAKRSTPGVRRELLESGLVEDDGCGGIRMHDYQQHQRTAEEVAAYKAERSTDGVRGAHQRWHVRRGVSDPDCKLCANR
jgi:hypothetical protein